MKEDCWANPGFVFKWIRDRKPPCPDDTALYLFRLTDNQSVKSEFQYLFNPKLHMGVNSVAKLFGQLCKLAGVEGNKTPHMMRAYVATKLANDPQVSSAEVAATLRHTSLQSQQAYIIPTVESEMKRIEALGHLEKKPTAKKKKKRDSPPTTG